MRCRKATVYGCYLKLPRIIAAVSRRSYQPEIAQPPVCMPRVCVCLFSWLRRLGPSPLPGLEATLAPGGGRAGRQTAAETVASLKANMGMSGGGVEGDFRWVCAGGRRRRVGGARQAWIWLGGPHEAGGRPSCCACHVPHRRQG